MTDQGRREAATSQGGSRRRALALLGSCAAAALSACTRGSAEPTSPDPATRPSGTGSGVTTSSAGGTSASATIRQPGAPSRFMIVPDDYHVPYAGTAADGRRFFLSNELFDPVSGDAFVGLFLWKADGTFDRVRLDPVTRASGLPPGQAGPATGSEGFLRERLREVGRYRLEPISVAPFLTTAHGVRVGWLFSRFDGVDSLSVEPGDFICYYPPWDGVEYDT